MYNRKELKRQARKTLKKHYLILTVLCAIAIFFGTEFTGIKRNAQSLYDGMTDQVTVVTSDLRTDLDDAFESENDLLDVFIDSKLVTRHEEVADRLRAIQESSDAQSVLGRERGVFASIVNGVSSGQFVLTLWLALRSIIRSRKIVGILMILAGTAVSAAIWIFIRNMYKAILRRAALELRSYETMPLNHLLHFRMVRRWFRVGITLMLQSLFQVLWWLTIVGGAIKHYSYFMVPYIVAENPDIKPMDAINLSRRMMDGHKWECFVLDLSFLGWAILGYMTFGAVDILFTVPYRVAAYSEYYALIRGLAKEAGIPGAELLNDDALFGPASEEELRSRYADIIGREDLVDVEIVDLPPVLGFFARNFGIWLSSLAEKKVFSRQEGLRQQMRQGQLEYTGQAYPQRLNPLWTREAAALTGEVNYLSPCTIWSLIIVFFTFCMVGWVYEVSIHLVKDGVFVNRGVMHGPWLPIYGIGVLAITVLLYRFRKKPLVELAAIVVVCGVVEYFTSLILEMKFGMRWWDYSGYFLNLNGRICAEGLAVFALGGMAAVYMLVPIIDTLTNRIKTAILVPLCIVLLVCFFSDMIYSHFYPNSGEGITDYDQVEESASAWDAYPLLSEVFFTGG